MASTSNVSGHPDMEIVSHDDAALAAHAATVGDLGQLNPEQRTALYGAICRSVGLNPVTRPFEFIKLNGKLTLYALKGATDQLRKINGVSIVSVDKELIEDVLMVTVSAVDRTGRQDTEIGAVTIAGLKGEALANSYMKATTKAKRRVTLSLCGLGFLDETEVSSIPQAEATIVDPDTGEIEDGHQVTPALDNGLAYDGRRNADDRERANKALHAWANDVGITHGDLHYAAQQLFSKRRIESLRDLSAADLDSMHAKLREKDSIDHEKLLAWLDSINPDDPRGTRAAEVEVVDPETGEIGLPGIEDNAELDRNIDAVAAHFRS